MLAHPRWEMVFQPRYAAYLNLIEPWWKVLRSLALAGRRFETWDEVTEAVAQATDYWNAHRHPFVWPTAPPPAAPSARHRAPTHGRTTCRMNHLVLQPGFMVVRPSVPVGSAGALLMASAPG